MSSPTELDPLSDGTETSPNAPSPNAPSPNASVLAGLRVDGLDLDHARRLVAARAARRLRRRHLTLGGLAAALAVALAAVLWPHPQPQHVVAADDTTTSTTTTALTTTTSTAVVVTTVAPTTVAPSTTSALPSLTTVPPTAPATTAPPPNRPMTVTAQITAPAADQSEKPTTAPLAGDTVWAVVNWSDPDLADPTAVDVRVDFGDQLLTTTDAAAPRPACTAAGAGASGQAKIPFRYSTAGAATVNVTVTACNGDGPYGERVSAAIALRVGAPVAGSRVVVLGGVADGFSGDAADVVVSGTDPIPPRTPDLHQVFRSVGKPATDGKPATVALIPSSFAGIVTLRWTTPSTLCQSTIAPVQPTTDGATANAPLTAGAPSICPAGQLAGSPTSR